MSGGGPERVEGVGRASIQGDVRFAEMLERMGAGIAMGENWIEAGAGAAAHSGGKLRAIDADFNHIPDAAMAKELRKLGAAVEEGADFLRIAPPATGLAAGASIDTYDDHRMAMCFSLAALGGVAVRINDPQCVNKTFPGYFDALARISA